ncbi:MAG: sulfatase [Desulfuromonas sp.]|nr:MAG: sulfatase [Desulfuromonas sp.]
MKASRFQLAAALAGMILLLFSLIRAALLVISWHEASPQLYDLAEIFSTGLLFDCGFLAYAMLPLVFYLWLIPERIWHSRWHGCLMCLVTLGIVYFAGLVAVAEFLFWEEFRTRFNFIAIDYLIYRREVTDNIFQSYPVIPILLALMVVAVLAYLPLRPWLARALKSTETFASRSLVAGLYLLLPLAAFLLLDQPLRQVSDNVYLNELAGNGPYQFAAAFRNNELDYDQFYVRLPEQEADRLLRAELTEANAHFVSNDLFDIRRDIVNPGPEHKFNIVLITVESLSSDFLGVFGNTKGLTPNLDRLVGESLFFSNVYATGTRTTRGLEALTLSIPPTPGRSIIKRLGRENDQWSLGNVLNDKGYQSYFAYGGRGYFENMNSFFSTNGYRIIDQTTVPEEEIGFTNAWGMADEDLYRQVLKTADAEAGQTPFFIHVMTTSNHRPYSYPDGRIDIPSGSGRKGAVKYTDYAIGEFLKQAQAKPWFDDTLFVIVADHQAGSAGKHTLPVERYHIPLWVYAPAQLKPRIVATLSSQIDLAPTLLGLLNLSYRSCFFGHDILRSPPNRALIANYQNLGLFDGGRMAILEPRQNILLQQGFVNGDINEQNSSKNDDLVRRDIGYYQGAAYVYRHHINAWSARNEGHSPAVAVTAAPPTRTL